MSVGVSCAKVSTTGRGASIAPLKVRESVLSSAPGEAGVLSCPFHVITGAVSQGHEISDIRFHRLGALEGGRDLCQIGQGLFVSSPEQCFLQLSSVLSLANLILAGCELCSSFRYPIDHSDELPRHTPVTSPEKLSRFLEAHSGAYGVNKAKRALRYVHENTASPAEGVLAVLLCSPYSLGGYGLPKPLVNRKIKVTGAAKRATKHPYFVADLYWPQAKLDVEYDGNAYHASHEARSKDAERANALDLMGVKVVDVTRDQLFSCEDMHGVAVSLAKRLGKKIRPKGDFETRRLLLRTKLIRFLRFGKFDQPGLYQ